MEKLNIVVSDKTDGIFKAVGICPWSIVCGDPIIDLLYLGDRKDLETFIKKLCDENNITEAQIFVTNLDSSIII